MTAGSGTCEAAAEAAPAGHALAALGYGGPSAAHGEPEPEVAESTARVAALLSLYNGGRLCRRVALGGPALAGPFPFRRKAFLRNVQSMSTPQRRPSVALFLTACLTLAACSSGERPSESGSAASDSVAPLLDAVPPEARVAVGAGGPRSSAYWVRWSTCGEGSRAETAAANGGRAAGWFLVDDLLSDPGIALGNHPVPTCEEGVAILERPASDLVGGLARQLFTAQLNLNAGSEACPAAEELVIAGNTLLSLLEYDGSAIDPDSLDAKIAESVARVTTLLTIYNSGVLCE